MRTHALIMTLLAVCACPAGAHAADLPPIEMSAVIAAPREKVWEAFTTTEGAKKWMVSQADIQMKLGAVWKTKYGPQGTLGDDGTIFNELLAFDPGHMFAIRIQKPPKGFPFMNVYRDMWTVVYFDSEEGGKTRVTLRGHGLPDNDEGRKMHAFFTAGNKQTLEMLAKHFEKANAETSFTGRARDVLADGTLVVERKDIPGVEERIALWGIALPERAMRREALNRLKDLAVGLEVTVIPKRSNGGRMSGIVTSHEAYFLYPEMGSGAINYILLRDGLAKRDSQFDAEDPALKRFEAEARTARRSLWSKAGKS
jgi:uncharacterized protein YndB with AHSA1/START domain